MNSVDEAMARLKERQTRAATHPAGSTETGRGCQHDRPNLARFESNIANLLREGFLGPLNRNLEATADAPLPSSAAMAIALATGALVFCFCRRRIQRGWGNAEI
jgi:hypothetical protein